MLESHFFLFSRDREHSIVSTPLQGTLTNFLDAAAKNWSGNPPFRSIPTMLFASRPRKKKKMRGHPDPTEQGPRSHEIDEENLSITGGAEHT
jgi:hypothetical protein